MKSAAWAVLAVTCLTHGSATAGDRLRVVVPNPEQDQVQTLLERVAEAVTAEDYAAYVACFTEKAKTKNAILAPEAFVTSDMQLTLGRWLIKSSSPEKKEIVVSYTISHDGQEQRFVSTLECVTDGSRLLIANENSKALPLEGSPGESPSYARTTDRRAAPDHPIGPPRQRKEIYLFTDADGHPDINGIMWLDPKKLVEAFPEKYAGCKQLREMGIDCRTGKPIR
jgi:hypothetical protein